MIDRNMLRKYLMWLRNSKLCTHTIHAHDTITSSETELSFPSKSNLEYAPFWFLVDRDPLSQTQSKLSSLCYSMLI